MLFVFAVGSLATYGAVMAGWASNSNWGLLGSMRASAQMISYEVTMGLSIVGLFMCFGTLKLTEMAALQDDDLPPVRLPRARVRRRRCRASWRG